MVGRRRLGVLRSLRTSLMRYFFFGAWRLPSGLGVSSLGWAPGTFAVFALVFPGLVLLFFSFVFSEVCALSLSA